jgi:hypothetical protein
MGCASSSEVAPVVVAQPAASAECPADSEGPALRVTPRATEVPSGGLTASRTFATNPHMDMTFSVLHDPSISAAHEPSESSQARNANPLRANRSSARPNDVSSTTRVGSLAVRGAHGSRGGSRNTQLALVIASPGVSGTRVVANDSFPSGALQRSQHQSGSSQSTSTNKTPVTPFTFENVKKYTELENDKLRALAREGGPPVKGYPRTWLELMHMWVDDLPTCFEDIPLTNASFDEGDLSLVAVEEGTSTPGFIASAMRSRSMSADGSPLC